MLALLVSLAGGMVACGGSVHGSNKTTVPGTTSGSYTITVTGTSGATTTKGTVTLTVQ